MNINTFDEFISEARTFSLSKEEKEAMWKHIKNHLSIEEKMIPKISGEPLFDFSGHFKSFKKYSTTFSLMLYGMIHTVWKRTRSLRK